MSEIIEKLGLNLTLVVHMLLFLVGYFIMNRVIFSPLMGAFVEREKRTTGSVMHTAQMKQETEELEAQYAESARALQVQIQSYFDSAKGEVATQDAANFNEARQKIEKQRADLQIALNEERQLAFSQIDTGLLADEVLKKLVKAHVPHAQEKG